MNFKIEKETETHITCSVEHNGAVILADFSKSMYRDKGYVDSENATLLTDETPPAQVLAQMMRELGEWVVLNYSDKLTK